MNINLFLVFFVITCGLVFSTRDSKYSRKIYIIICIALLNFVAAMRSPEWFTNQYEIDSAIYKENFEQWRDMDWKEIMTVAYLRYFSGEDDGDIGYLLINRIFGSFTTKFQLFSLLANLIFFIPFGKILYRYTSHIFQIIFAFVFYIAMLQVMFISGARQMFAIGLDMMALLALMNKKILKTAILYIIGISIHFSSILFFIPLIMIWLNIKPERLKLIHLICFILFPIVVLFPGQMVSLMGNAIGMEKYAQYGEGAIQGGATVFIIMIEMLSLFCYVAIKSKNLMADEVLKKFYVMVPLFTLFAPLIRSGGTMIRVSLYFHLFIFIIVPYAIECLSSQREKKLSYLGGIGVLALYSVSSGYDYYFFWQR